MQFKLFAIAAIFAGFAAAAPCPTCHSSHYDGNDGDWIHDNGNNNNNDNGNVVQQCGDKGITSCCNPGEGSGGILGGGLAGVLGCTPILGILGQNACSGNVACCQGDSQTGLLNLNLGCTQLG